MARKGDMVQRWYAQQDIYGRVTRLGKFQEQVGLGKEWVWDHRACEWYPLEANQEVPIEHTLEFRTTDVPQIIKALLRATGGISAFSNLEVALGLNK
jgi:hypothetical protein